MLVVEGVKSDAASGAHLALSHRSFQICDTFVPAAAYVAGALLLCASWLDLGHSGEALSFAALVCMVVAYTIRCITCSSGLVVQHGCHTFNEPTGAEIVSSYAPAAGFKRLKVIGLVTVCIVDVVVLPFVVASAPQVLGDDVPILDSVAAYVLWLRPHQLYPVVWVSFVAAVCLGAIGFGYYVLAAVANPYEWDSEEADESEANSRVPTKLWQCVALLSSFLCLAPSMLSVLTTPLVCDRSAGWSVSESCGSTAHIGYSIVALIGTWGFVLPVYHMASVSWLHNIEDFRSDKPRSGQAFVSRSAMDVAFVVRLLKITVVPTLACQSSHGAAAAIIIVLTCDVAVAAMFHLSPLSTVACLQWLFRCQAVGLAATSAWIGIIKVLVSGNVLLQRDAAMTTFVGFLAAAATVVVLYVWRFGFAVTQTSLRDAYTEHRNSGGVAVFDHGALPVIILD